MVAVFFVNGSKDSPRTSPPNFPYSNTHQVKLSGRALITARRAGERIDSRKEPPASWHPSGAQGPEAANGSQLPHGCAASGWQMRASGPTDGASGAHRSARRSRVRQPCGQRASQRSAAARHKSRQRVKKLRRASALSTRRALDAPPRPRLAEGPRGRPWPARVPRGLPRGLARGRRRAERVDGWTRGFLTNRVPMGPHGGGGGGWTPREPQGTIAHRPHVCVSTTKCGLERVQPPTPSTAQRPTPLQHHA